MSETVQQTLITLGAMTVITLGLCLLAWAVIRWVYRPRRKERKGKGKRK